MIVTETGSHPALGWAEHGIRASGLGWGNGPLLRRQGWVCQPGGTRHCLTNKRGSWDWELFGPLPREPSSRPVPLRHGSVPPVVPHRRPPQRDTRGRPAQIVPNGPLRSPEPPWSVGKTAGGGEGKDVGEEQECSLKKKIRKTVTWVGEKHEARAARRESEAGDENRAST